MTYSKYANGVILAHSSNFQIGRAGCKIERITPHHMAGNMSADSCATYFQTPYLYASANYCIGTDGRVICNVHEENRAFTSSSAVNDNRAITFEIANDGGAGWHVSDAAINSFINVAADVCIRHGIKRLKKGETLTWHSMFWNTTCPGDYLLAKMQWLEEAINARIASGQPEGVMANAMLWTGFTDAQELVIKEGKEGIIYHNPASTGNLDIVGGVSAIRSGTPVCFYKPNGGLNQEFEEEWYEEGTVFSYCLIHPVGHPHLCVDAWGAGIADGTQLGLWENTGADNQKWLKIIRNGKEYRVNLWALKCMDCSGGKLL